MANSQEDLLHKVRALTGDLELISGEDVEELLEETRAAAVEELRQTLVEVHKEALLSRLKEKGRQPDEETSSADIDALTAFLRSESQVTRFEDEDDTYGYHVDRKVENREGRKPKNAPVTVDYVPNGNHDNLYVFGVIRTAQTEEFRRELKSISTFKDASSLRLVSSGSMSAVLADVPSKLMSKKVISDRMHDPEWLEPHVQVHQRVQKRIMKHRTIIPMRFGTLFSSEERVRDFIRTHRQSLYDALSRLDNAQEWGVKLFATAAAIDPDQTSKPASTGREFFFQKPKELGREEEQRRDLASKADYVHARLSKCAEEALINDPSNKLATGNYTIEALNGVYLINMENLSHFHETLHALQNDLEKLGYNLQLNGPWPPYHFVRLDTSAGIQTTVS